MAINLEGPPPYRNVGTEDSTLRGQAFALAKWSRRCATASPKVPGAEHVSSTECKCHLTGSSAFPRVVTFALGAEIPPAKRRSRKALGWFVANGAPGRSTCQDGRFTD